MSHISRLIPPILTFSRIYLFAVLVGCSLGSAQAQSAEAAANTEVEAATDAEADTNRRSSPSPVDIERMETWLTVLAQGSSAQGNLIALADFAFGTLTAIYFGLTLTDADRDPAAPKEILFPAVALGASGATLFGSLSYALVGTNTDVPRLARWQALREAGEVDSQVLHRFEGQLQANAEFGALQRRTSGMTFLGLAVAGAALDIAALSTAYEDEAQTTGLVLGSYFLAYGLWRGISNLVGQTAYEIAWSQYQQGLPNVTTVGKATQVSWQMSPTGLTVNF